MDRITVTWAILVAATLISYVFGHGVPGSPGVTTALVMGIAAIKARLVFHRFMEIAIAPPAWRRATDGWILIAVGGVLILYYGGR